MRLNIKGSIFCTKNDKKNDYEENKFNKRFGEFLMSKDILMPHIYKVTTIISLIKVESGLLIFFHPRLLNVAFFQKV